jgi:hypothetical protein
VSLSVVIGVVSLSNHTVRLSLRPSTSSGRQSSPNYGLPSPDFPPFGKLRAAVLSRLRTTDFLANCPSASSLRQAPFDRLRAAVLFDRLPSTGSLRQAPFDKLRAPPYRKIGELVGRYWCGELVEPHGPYVPPPFDKLRAPVISQLRTTVSGLPALRQAPFDRLPSTGSGRQSSPDSGLRTSLQTALRQAPSDKLPSTGSLRQAQGSSPLRQALFDSLHPTSSLRHAPFDRLRAPPYRKIGELVGRYWCGELVEPHGPYVPPPFDKRPSASSLRQAPFDKLRAAVLSRLRTTDFLANCPSTGSLR